MAIVDACRTDRPRRAPMVRMGQNARACADGQGACRTGSGRIPCEDTRGLGRPPRHRLRRQGCLQCCRRKKIGAIKHILNAPSGNMQAAVIGVARVLGIGEKDICVPLSAFKRVPQGNDSRIVLDISKDGLLAIPPFQQ